MSEPDIKDEPATDDLPSDKLSGISDAMFATTHIGPPAPDEVVFTVGCAAIATAIVFGTFNLLRGLLTKLRSHDSP